MKAKRFEAASSVFLYSAASWSCVNFIPYLPVGVQIERNDSQGYKSNSEKDVKTNGDAPHDMWDIGRSQHVGRNAYVRAVVYADVMRGFLSPTRGTLLCTINHIRTVEDANMRNRECISKGREGGWAYGPSSEKAQRRRQTSAQRGYLRLALVKRLWLIIPTPVFF